MVELCDISESGLSCLLRISVQENARLLLGNKMQLKLPRGVKSGNDITLVGDILAVKKSYAVENDYSLHIKFDSLLDRKQLQEVVTGMREEPQVVK
jgi:hypothetical protein